MKYFDPKKQGNLSFLSFITSLLDGIGSGAGVAWPYYGILIPLLGATIGSFLSIHLAIAAVAVFCCITLGVFFLSFQKKLEEENNAVTRYHYETKKLFQLLDKFLANNQNKKLLDDVNNPDNNAFDLLTAKQENKYHNLVSLTYLLNALSAQKTLLLPKNKDNYYEEIIGNIPIHPIQKIQLLGTAFMKFVSTAGSLVGCSAGIAGLLGNIALFTTFSSIPIIGWGILGAGVVLGIAVACVSVYKEMVKLERINLQQNIKALRHDIKQIMQPPPPPLAPAPQLKAAKKATPIRAPIVKAKASKKVDLLQSIPKVKQGATSLRATKNIASVNPFFLNGIRKPGKNRVRVRPVHGNQM